MSSTRSEYKIFGDVDLFQMQKKIIGELIEKMAAGLPENVKLQITLETVSYTHLTLPTKRIV